MATSRSSVTPRKTTVVDPEQQKLAAERTKQLEEEEKERQQRRFQTSAKTKLTNAVQAVMKNAHGLPQDYCKSEVRKVLSELSENL